MAKIELTCKNCHNNFIVAYKARKRKFCSRACVDLYQTGTCNPAYGKTYRTKETHPEWASKVSETHLSKGYILGEKNPMKKPEVAAKMGATRSKKFQTDENFRNTTSNLVKKAWEEGKYKDVQVGKCKWYKFTKQDGTICNLQGTWEVAYATWLEKQNINFIAHKGRIPFFDKNGNQRSYYPDFYLPDSNEFIDIKNQFHYELNKEKWEMIKASNPELKIVLIFEKELKEKGII